MKRRVKARKTVTSKKRTVKTGTHGKLTKMLNQAKRAEKLALKQLGIVTRKNKAMIAKMRRTIKAKLAAKARTAARIRTQLVKKHATYVRKLRKEHATAIKKLHKMVKGTTTGRKTKSKRTKSRTKGKTMFAKHTGFVSSRPKRRKSRAKSFSYRRRSARRGMRKAA